MLSARIRFCAGLPPLVWRCGSAALAWLGSATAGHSGKAHAPLFRCNCAGGAVERVGQQLQPDQLISRRFEACLALFG